MEGAEEKVIKGFGDRLKEVDVLQIEWIFRKFHRDQMKLSRLMALLEKFGFSGFRQIELSYLKNKPYICDLIFFRE